MSLNVSNYTTIPVGFISGGGRSGNFSTTFYSPSNHPANVDEIKKMVNEKLKEAIRMVYNCSDDISLRLISEIYNTETQYEEFLYTTGYLCPKTYNIITRKCALFWECLGGVLVLTLEHLHLNSSDSINSFFKEDICVQMESAQGDVTQESNIAGNTIVTADANIDTEEEKVTDMVSLLSICNTEENYTFDSIVNRWMALNTITVTTSNSFNEMLQVYNLPKFLYSESYAPNLMPFQNFVYGNYNIEFKFVVNANKFHVGKVVCAVKNDSYQIDGIRNDVVDLLSRPHIILDLSVNNEGVLSVPFKYHRTFVRNASANASNFGIKDAQYATINVAVLSQLKAVAGAPTRVDIRPLYRIKQATFAGMTYGVPVVQMEGAIGALVLEKGLKYFGVIPNKDKPIDLVRQSQYIPKPRLNFSTGKGASDVAPIKIDPTTLTTFMPEHIYKDDPQSTYDIARIWGFAGKFEWSMSQQENTLLYTQAIDPTWRLSGSYQGVPTPLEYVASMYQFWSGPLEFRFDFVSNAFHTGSVLISAEFGRSANSLEQASSTYTKLFHLGEQKTVTFVAPYIYDTVWRRTQCVPFCGIQTNLTAGPYGFNALLRTMSSKLNIRVVNALVPVSSVTPNIDVLVFVRAGENFILHSPIMANLLNSELSYEIDNFPGSYAESIPATSLVQISPRMLKGRTGKQMRAYWATHIPTTPKERYSDVESKNDVPLIAHPNLVDPVAREEEREEAIKERILDNNSTAFKPLVDFQEKHKNFKTGYSTNNYKYQGINKGFLQFSVLSNTYMANLAEEKIFDALSNSWVEYNVFHTRHPHFHKNAFIKFCLDLKISEIPTDTIVQMDRGDDSNLDPTRVFNQGVKRDKVQTVDSHMNIKDLLRRPVMIVYNQSVPAFTGGNFYYIPCMPPSHMMALLSDNRSNRIYCANLGRSYHVHLNDLFRFWRGSQRWTFVIRGTNDVVYVAYVPHSGARLVGEIVWNNVTGGSCPLGAFGLGTEMIVPTINPTFALETPFDMEDNWALMLNEQANRNFSWRDKGDTNSGHIVIWSPSTFNYDLWWSAGDDFSVANFIGIPPCINGMNIYYQNDNYPVVQMESIINTIGSISIPEFGTMSSVVPLAGASLAVGATCYKATKMMHNMDGHFEELVKQLSDTLNGLAARFEWSTNMVQWLTESLCDLILVFVNWNVTTFSITLLRLFSRIFSISFSSLAGYVSKLISIFSEGAATQAATPKEIISGPFWTEGRIAKFIGLIVGLVGLGSGIRTTQPDSSFIHRYFCLFKEFKTFAYMNNVVRFIQLIMDLIMGCIKWCCSSLNVEIAALERMSDREDYLGQFVTESQTLLDEANANMFGNPAFKTRFWAHCIKARQIQREIVKLPTNQVSAVLTRVCADVIRKGNEKMCDLRSAPIKYEPFVICISGDTKVGKSTMVRFMVPHILAAMGITSYSSDPIYTRMQSSRFWNCYVDQPVVLIDEWLNITEPSILAESINELYMLKSCATFIPEQAALEDKKARASPKIVILLCNNAFPTSAISSVAPNVDAVLRRRDVLIHVARKREYESVDLRSLTPEDSKNCVHMQAQFYADSRNPNSLQDEIFDFCGLKDKLVDLARKYDEQEIQRVKLELSLMNEYSANGFGTIDEDPFAIFYNHRIAAHEAARPDIIPSEQLEAYMNILSARLTSSNVEDILSIPVNDNESMSGEPATQGFMDVVFETAQDCKKWVEESLRNLFNLPKKVGRCSYCNKLTEGVSMCKSRYGYEMYGNHILCSVCDTYAAQFVHGILNGKQCPVCTGDIVPIFTVKQVKVLQFIAKWKKETRFSKIFMGRLKELLPAEPVAKAMLLQTVVVIIATISEMAVLFTKVFYSKELGNVQMDFEGDGKLVGSDSYNFSIKGDKVSYQFNDIGFQAFDKEIYDSKVESPGLNTCIHKESFENIIGVRYENKRFIIVLDDEYSPLPVSRCSKNCVWGDINYRRQFCKAYFDQHIGDIKTELTRSACNPDMKELVVRRYPPFMMPPWFSVKCYIKREEHWYDNFNLPKAIKTALKITAGIAAALGLFKSMSWIYHWVTGGGKDEIQAYNRSDSEMIQHFKHDVKPVSRKDKHQSKMSAGQVQSMLVEDSVIEKIVHNCISIYVYKGTELVRTLNGTGIKQRIAVIPRHYYNYIKTLSDEYKLKVGRTRMKDHQIQYLFDEKDFLVSETSDICLFYMPASTNMFKDITKYIHTDEDYKKARSSKGQMVRAPNKDTTSFFRIELDIVGFKPECSIREGSEYKVFKDLLEYNYSEIGACGSLVLVDSHQHPIMAMHVAGHGDKWSGTGFGVLLSKELFDDILEDQISCQAMEYEEPDFIQDIENSKIFISPEYNIDAIGSLAPNHTPFTPYQSKIQPSLISKDLVWAPTKQPAILSKKDSRYKHDISPLVAGCSKHGVLTEDFKTSDLKIVREARGNKLSKLQPTIMNAKRLSIEEAISGIDFQEYYETIKLDTSAGWPWCCSMNTTKNKYCKVEKNENGETVKVILDNEIRKEITRKEQLRREGVVPFTIFIDTLKDEKRSVEKLMKLGGTRVFCASPFDYTIAMRQNFMHFLAAYMKYRMDFNHAVGIDVNGTEITTLVRRLLEKGNNIITIDYTNFGPGFNAGIAANVKLNVINWVVNNIEGTNVQELSCLFEEGIGSLHAMNNFVYRQKGGSPSGSPITVVINSEVNIQYIYMAWLNLTKLTGNAWTEFDTNVALYVYGDDLIMSVSDKYIEVFNGKTIQTFFSSYGIVSTDAAKSSTVREYESIYTASFLKRTFDHHPIHKTEWIAKPDMDSVKDCPHWIQENLSKREATIINAEACLRMAYGHGEKIFNWYKEKINKALVKRRMEPVNLSWDLLDREHYPNYY